MIAMILAAGRGERLRPITDNTPKALIEVAGVSLLERHLQMLRRANVTTVVINLGWLGEQVVDKFGSGADYGLQIVYSPEYEQILETGGGIRRALPLLGQRPFWVVNADVFTDFRLPAPELPPGKLARLVLVPSPPYKSCGDFALGDGEVRNTGSPAYTFSGIACYSPQFFEGAAEGRFPLAPMLREAADRGTLAGSLYEGVWRDVGSPDRLRALNEEFC